MKQEPEIRPNIIFFFSDQQRFDTLGVNGQDLPITPNLDMLAKEGVNFKKAFTPQPVCGPARACLQTGLYATQTGCYRNAIPLPLEQKTIAHHLKNSGYDVAYVGKWHLASDEHTNHFETKGVPLERRGGYDDYWMASDVLEFTSHGYDGYVHNKDGEKVEFKGYRADCITDFALDFINDYSGNKPFFLFLSHIEPHHQNDRQSYEGPNGSKELFKDFTTPDDLEKGKGDWEEFYPDYLGCCNALDRNLGRLIETLKDKGIYDDTVIIYTSDHGCHFRTIRSELINGGFDDYKRNSFENTIHIPLIIKGDVFSHGREEEKLVSLLDLPKTILEIGKCDIPEKMVGRQLQEVENVDWEEEVYIQISESFVGRALRTKDFKYVVYAPDAHPVKDMLSENYIEKYLFDLNKDPLEKCNLLNDNSYDEIRKVLRKSLVRHALKAGEGDITILGK